MGANPVNESKGGEYYKPREGYMVKKPTGSPDEALKAFTYDGKSTTYAVYSSLEGYITALKIQESKDPKYGNKLVIDLMDGPDSYHISIPYDSVDAMSVYGRMKNIDFNKSVRLKSWKKDEDKYYRFLIQQQDGSGEWKTVPHSFTMDEVPKWKPVKLNGRVEYDKEECLKFYAKHLKEVMYQLAHHGNTAKKQPVAALEDMPEDDLPF